MNDAPLRLTAAYLKAAHGYVGFIEELPQVSSQGRTLEEARSRLQVLAVVVFEEERRHVRETTAGKELVREPFVIAP